MNDHSTSADHCIYSGFQYWLVLSSLVGFTLIYHVNTRAFKVPFPGVVMPNLQGTVRSITLPRAL